MRYRCANLLHLKQRAAERYGLSITRADLAQVRKDIADGKWMRVCQQADGSEQVVGRVGETLVRLAWEPKSKIIRTFLPLETKLNRKRM